MKQWKKQLSAALCAALLLGCVSMPALAEENEEYDLSDIPGVIIEDPRIDPLEWNFALSLCDLDPELIKLANKECLLSSTYEPSSKTKMKLRAAPGAGTMYLLQRCSVSFSTGSIKRISYSFLFSRYLSVFVPAVFFLFYGACMPIV